MGNPKINPKNCHPAAHWYSYILEDGIRVGNQICSEPKKGGSAKAHRGDHVVRKAKAKAPQAQARPNEKSILVRGSRDPAKQSCDEADTTLMLPLASILL